VTKNINVLHVVSISFSLPYFVGDQFLHFKEKGVSFYVASSPSEHFFKYAVEKKFVPLPLRILRAISPMEDIRSVFRLRKLILQHNIQLVIGHTPKGGLISMLASYLAGISDRIYVRHGIMFETARGLKRWLLKSMEQLTGAMATKVVCVSNSIMEVSEREHLSSRKKNLLLGKGTCNGVDSNGRFNPENVPEYVKEKLRGKYNIGDNDFVVGFVGRLVNDKGIKELIQAWQLLLNEKTNIKLLLVGPFEERDALDEDIKNFIKHEPSVILTGLVDDPRDYYTIMNVFILPSYREGLPTVVLEASSMELPIITTKATGCVDAIIEDETGIFCTYQPVDIAGKIKYYLHNRQIAQKHGANGRNFVSGNFEQHLVWNEIEQKVLKLK
jgi:glycosyltransferase involved in cell wall biosynthesis